MSAQRITRLLHWIIYGLIGAISTICVINVLEQSLAVFYFDTILFVCASGLAISLAVYGCIQQTAWRRILVTRYSTPLTVRQRAVLVSALIASILLSQILVILHDMFPVLQFTIRYWLWGFGIIGILATTILLIKQTLTPPKTPTVFSWKKRPLILIIIAACIVFGVGIRLYHLGTLGYSTDEGSTALYSAAINNTGTPCIDSICYLRGLPYLYSVAALTQFVGVHEWSVRLPGVIMGLITIVLASWLIYRVSGDRFAALLSGIFLLIADWHVMMSRYARMYPLLAIWMLATCILYYETFYRKRQWMILLLCITTGLAILTHQFGMLLLYFIIEPAISGRWKLYRQPLYLLYATVTVLSVGLALTKLPGIIYTDTHYVALYDLRPDLLAASNWWFLQNLQLPQLTYLQQLLVFIPGFSIIALASLLAAIIQPTSAGVRFLSWGVLSFIVVLMIYKIDYAPKYLWWLLIFLTLLGSWGVMQLYKSYPRSAIVCMILICIQALLGDAMIAQRDYGQLHTGSDLIRSSHVEEYHPDDKTTVEYVAKHYKPGDIIITDYWMQDVYLQLLLGRHSDYFINRWSVQSFLKKFPYYKLYHEGISWRMQKNGAISISNILTLQQIISESQNQRIWYITSADFENKQYLYISKKIIDAYMKEFHADDRVYTGRDDRSAVFFIDGNDEQ